MELDYPLIWAGLIAFAVLAYVILDGFDLGIGILFPFFPQEKDRDMMMNSVAPVWDGNETWLVLGGGGLFAVFPLAYSVIMPALYAPIILMLLALTFRGVAFEFRWKTRRGKFLWDWAFAGGSLLATFAQGIALGALVQGIPVVGRAYAGGWWNWLTPFSLTTGVALVLGYALLGAGWLIYKTEGVLQDRAFQAAKFTGIATLALFSSGVIFTPSFLKRLMLSLCVSSVPLVGPAYKSVRQLGVPPRYSATVLAAGLEASILPFRLLNSATVRSLVQHCAEAALITLPDPSNCAGVKGLLHLAASGVARILVVVCKSHCECRQTSSLSLVNVTSHSTMPAPMRAAAS